MGGCRCSYKNCERATNNSEKNFHFFHYPSKDFERSLKWIANAKKPAFLDLPKDQLRNKVVCQNHFEMHCFTNANKKRLVHHAVPTLDMGCTDNPETVSVKVLQSDANGTVFTVDTESMNVHEINKVRSFLITNGDVVPAHSSPEEGSDVDEIEISKHELYSNSYDDFKIEDTMEGIEEISAKNESNDISEHFKPTESTNIVLENDNLEISFPVPPLTPRPVFSIPVPPLTPRPVLVRMTDSISQNKKTTPISCDSPDIFSLSKTVQKHTKEITKLKKVLNARMRKTKFKKREILNKLRSLIPSTLYAAVSLHMFRKREHFTHAEKHFLTTLYQSPPAVISVLNNQFKWKLPDSDQVRNMLLNCPKLT
ncbi:hypothetical protein RI129_011591 [Pyrocoelia pectoralis]|uniref:THAP-type domain-containing protein n=1 Tax=Pyrocoelia pectoralis TaxID=417401 RepID=A0AAN7V311_9COLE